ncbi:MAG: metallophosphoesterase [Candidatus Nanoarchaeia archaeon]|nr:metallophosphoesterase [Candidatus Nanoarchaeia archaeon]
MEMVLISDIHLGRYKYGRMNDKGYDSRTQDILDNIQQALDYANNHRIKTIVVLGDFYHTKRPAQVFRRLLASKFEWALDKGIKLYLLLGNHDQGKSHGHDLVELVEMSTQIENLRVIEIPTIIEVEDSVLCFMPHVNTFDVNIESKKFHDYVIESVEMLAAKAKASNKKYKYFFGHYPTDKSVAGKSFDMGQDEKSNKVLPIKIFDQNIWTKVYLGDIHKQQEMNFFCRHVGSVAKVDFGEEGEKKGFYYVKDDEDTFIPIKDREFKTLFADLRDDARQLMMSFCESVQDMDLSESVVRLKIVINETDKKLINFDGIEEYLKEESWNYIGKNIEEIRQEKSEIKIKQNDELNYVSMFRSYIEQAEIEMKEDILKVGEEVLADVMNS